MRALTILVVLALAAASPAFAQQRQPQSAQDQIATTIGTLIMRNAALAEQAQQMQQMQARITQLERDLAAAKGEAEPKK